MSLAIDQLVAKHLYGIDPSFYEDRKEHEWKSGIIGWADQKPYRGEVCSRCGYIKGQTYPSICSIERPTYSDNPARAMDLIRHLSYTHTVKIKKRQNTDEWVVKIYEGDGGFDHKASKHRSLSMAICVAALAAKGFKPDGTELERN